MPRLHLQLKQATVSARVLRSEAVGAQLTENIQARLLRKNRFGGFLTAPEIQQVERKERHRARIAQLEFALDGSDGGYSTRLVSA